MATQYKKLEQPPIQEVVCGVLFEPIPGLDPVTLGSYWKLRRDAFPRRELKAALLPTPPPPIGFRLGPDLGPVRTWFISKDDVFIIQVQQDRFYVNWRARGAEYPRFTDRMGGEGLLRRFLYEYGIFARFCETELVTAIQLRGIELAKIDDLERGRHWSDSKDLADFLPMLGPALELTAKEPTLSFQLSSPLSDGAMDVTLNSIINVGRPTIPIIHLECRRTIRRDLSAADLQPTFIEANDELNQLFFRLISENQLHRFAANWKAP